MKFRQPFLLSKNPTQWQKHSTRQPLFGFYILQSAKNVFGKVMLAVNAYNKYDIDYKT